MKNLPLAEFASNFQFTKKSKSCNSQQTDENELDYFDNDLYNDDESEESAEIVYHALIDGSGFVHKRIAPPKIIRFRHYSSKVDLHNYCREQLMLFIPWRNEEDDLININPVQRFNELKDEICRHSSIFHHKTDVDDESLRNIIDEVSSELSENSEDESDDLRAHIDEQSQLADMMLNNSSARENSKRKVDQFLPPRLIDNGEYSRLMQSLNAKQQKFVLNVLHLLKTGTTPFHMFLSGGAGVGKSLAITAIVQSALRYFGSLPQRNQCEIPVIVTAFTGKAAFNVFGMTLHSAFRLPPVQSPVISDLREEVRNSLQSKLSGLKLIIIDEVSMCSLKLLKVVDDRMRQITGSNLDFGGVSVLVVGHLRQLPPICGQFPFESEIGKEGIVNYLWRKFKIYELDQIMRQQGEAKMCRALNNMSEGAMDAADIDLIRSRQITDSNQPPPEAIWLFHTNAECAHRNQIVHDSLNTAGFLSPATDCVEGRASKTRRSKLLADAQNLSQQHCDGLRYQTYLKEQATYFISTNINVEDGLFNGATGKLMWIELKEHDPTSSVNCTDSVVRVWILFENPLIGAEKRKTYLSSHHNKFPNNVDRTWTPIERLNKPLSRLYNDNVKVIRQQFPLVACDGMTIAKSQGSSLNTVVVCTRSKLSRAQLYVACSRATSLNGLFIDGTFTAPKPPSLPDIVGNEMRRLRVDPLQLSIRYLQDYDSAVEKIYFHNVQSVYGHYLDVVSDRCAMAADFVIMVEPHLFASDSYDFPGFHQIHRVNCTSVRNSQGILLLAKSLSPVEVLDCQTDFSEVGHCIVLKFFTGKVTVIAAYKHPNYSKMDFLQLLEETLTETSGEALFMGDINLDLMNGQHKEIYACFKKFGYVSKLLLEISTTNGGTQIDCCFSNFHLQASTYESYYSYHKAICVTFPG